MTQFIGVRRGKCSIVDDEIGIARRLRDQATVQAEIEERAAIAAEKIEAANAEYVEAQLAWEADPTSASLMEARNDKLNALNSLTADAEEQYDPDQNFEFYRLEIGANGKPKVGRKVKIRVKTVQVEEAEVVDE